MVLHIFDLENRTQRFSLEVRNFLQLIPKGIINNEYIKQLVRSASSVGANYIEANESLGKKDFVMHIKICRKEAKESAYWLSLLVIESSPSFIAKRDTLAQEAQELIKIFTAICRKNQ